MGPGETRQGLEEKGAFLRRGRLLSPTANCPILKRFGTRAAQGKKPEHWVFTPRAPGSADPASLQASLAAEKETRRQEPSNLKDNSTLPPLARAHSNFSFPTANKSVPFSISGFGSRSSRRSPARVRSIRRPVPQKRKHFGIGDVPSRAPGRRTPFPAARPRLAAAAERSGHFP